VAATTRAVTAHLPPQRRNLDLQRLDQPALLGQLSGLCLHNNGLLHPLSRLHRHQSSKLLIEGGNRRLGHSGSQA